MRLAVAGFASGAWLLHQQGELPSWVVLAALAAAAGAVAALREWPARRTEPLATAFLVAVCAALGFAWAGTAAKVRLAERLDPTLEGRDLVITGVVAGLPQPFERGVRFEFDPVRAELADARGTAVRVPERILISWYSGLTREEFQELAPIRAGERWRFTVRLKLPHGNANPHGFDYELWLLERRIGATGYVRPRGERARLEAFVAAPAYAIERLRERLREKFWDTLPGSRYTGVLIALAIGDQRAIERGDWETFTRTGVGHLMSISGLHVTMISGLAAWVVGWLWRRSARLTLRIPARKAAAAAAFVAALGYALLSGFAVPAQRTLYMVGVVALALWLDRLQSSSRVLAAALAVVVALDPWAVLSPGFWLSFGSVALILYTGVGGPPHASWLGQFARTQWAITVGLTPLLLALFRQVSLVSPIANAVAIPAVSFVVTPLALAAAALPWTAPAELAHWVMELLMRLLDWLARAPGGVWAQHAPSAWTVALAGLGVAWLLAPRGFPARAIALVLMLPMFVAAPERLPEGTARITFLDVGQGLAAVVRTRDHVLLYDTGPTYGPETDAGDRVVVPYLRGEGLTWLDSVVVTHDDTDHSGGARTVLRTIPTGVVWSSLDDLHPAREAARYPVPCRAGVDWSWDGVRFETLHPAAQSDDRPLLQPNSKSCVLRVVTSHGAVLLTSDIEARDEEALLARGGALAADVLLVPHHGSRTSSSPGFLDAAAPRHAVVTAGYRNRFQHPRPDVLARYEERDVRIWRTDRDGAIDVWLGPGGVAVARYRGVERRYWRDKPEPAQALR